jgi:hypothetical protein
VAVGAVSPDHVYYGSAKERTGTYQDDAIELGKVLVCASLLVLNSVDILRQKGPVFPIDFSAFRVRWLAS